MSNGTQAWAAVKWCFGGPHELSNRILSNPLSPPRAPAKESARSRQTDHFSLRSRSTTPTSTTLTRPAYFLPACGSSATPIPSARYRVEKLLCLVSRVVETAMPVTVGLRRFVEWNDHDYCRRG